MGPFRQLGTVHRSDLGPLDSPHGMLGRMVTPVLASDSSGQGSLVDLACRRRGELPTTNTRSGSMLLGSCDPALSRSREAVISAAASPATCTKAAIPSRPSISTATQTAPETPSTLRITRPTSASEMRTPRRLTTSSARPRRCSGPARLDGPGPLSCTRAPPLRRRCAGPRR